jgi:hypothetical protein
MRISFDLDDTLICHGGETPCEPPPCGLWRVIAPSEPLRLGSRELMKALIGRGWEIWVYTTSHRRPREVRLWLRSYGIRVSGVVNGEIHERHFRKSGHPRPPSKHPGVFGIDLHVDDSDGVRMEGDLHRFRVVVIDPRDERWAERVLAAAEEVQSTRQPTPACRSG